MAYTAIDNPELYFQVKLYTGTGTSTAFTLDGSEDMQPDVVWFKQRGSNTNHKIFDAVRGVQEALQPNDVDAEATNANGLTAFGSDGFTIGDHGDLNTSSGTYVAWCWKAGGSASTDDAGTIDSSTSTSTTAGFSIATWTSTAAAHTIGHSLGVVPAVILMKGRHESNNWQVYHHKNTAAPETDYLMLDYTAATADYPVWNDTAPTSSVMSLGTWSGLDDSGTMVAYIFAEKQGFSKFGSYTGNGNVDGPFIYTGFRPAYFVTRRTDSANSWAIFDNKRDPHNEVVHHINADGDEVDEAGTADNDVDFCANGVKIREDNNGCNADGGTYVYLAFAEAPLVNSEGVPCNAR